MMEYYDQEPVSHIDCVGKRCFGFSMGNSVSEWFRPAISLDNAVKQIEKKTGIPVAVTDTQKKNDNVLKMLKSGAVVGPVWSLEAVPEIRHLYYHGDTRYLFISGDNKGCYRITDLEGFPEFWANEKEVLEMLKRDRPYVLHLEKKIFQRKYVNFKEILEEGLSFFRCLNEEKNQVFQAVKDYRESPQNRLAIQYGLINCMQNMDKVFRLAAYCEAVNQKDMEAYLALKNRTYHLCVKKDILELPYLLDAMWELLI